MRRQTYALAAMAMAAVAGSAPSTDRDGGPDSTGGDVPGLLARHGEPDWTWLASGWIVHA